MTRSLESFDDGYLSGIKEGVRWSIATVEAMLREVPHDREHTLIRFALANVIGKLEQVPLDKPLSMPSATSAGDK